MKTLAAEIDALFQTDPPRRDESGCLSLALRRMRRYGATSCRIVDARKAVALAGAEDNTPAGNGCPEPHESASWPLQRHDLSLEVNGVGPSVDIPDEVRDDVLDLARCALQFVDWQRRLFYHQTRARHLENEERVLRNAFTRTIETVLEEREARLREKHRDIDDLERQVNLRSEALRVALNRAESANRAKTVFLANMSHEIRTPITAVLGYAETLLEPAMSEGERIAAVHTIQRNAAHLLDVINDILDLSKIETGHLEIEHVPCRLDEILADVSAVMRGRSAQKGLELTFGVRGPAPRMILSDPMRLRQILINLVGNAVKFTERGQVRVTISAPSCEPDAAIALTRRLDFEVRDTGIGISSEEITRIFEPFSQADSSTTRRFGGSGLGLAITRRLANLMHGEVAVDSRPGVGSTFVARVRVGIAQDAGQLDQAAIDQALAGTGPAPRPTAMVDLRQASILVAEDGPDNQRLIQHILTRANARVSIVENGMQAIQSAEQAEQQGTPFDLVLMDMQMPELDGYAATAKLRSQGYRRPIVALTAHAMMGDRERCLSAGCDDFAVKPIDRERLFAIIQTQIARARAKAR